MKKWRDRLKIHPAADLFPAMTPEQLRELADDIQKNGLRNKMTLFRENEQTLYLLDGRSRADALELLGWELFREDKHRFNENFFNWVPDWDDSARAEREKGWSFDPYACVVSLNIQRRHLTADQKRDIIAKLLKARPEKSDRQIAATVGVDNKTVAKVRRREEIPHVSKRVDTKGRQQPARKPKPAPAIFASAAQTARRLREPATSSIEKAISTAVLIEKLEPIIEGLLVEGRKNMVTMSPGTVATWAGRLKNLLAVWTGRKVRVFARTEALQPHERLGAALEADFETRVQAEVQRRLDEAKR